MINTTQLTFTRFIAAFLIVIYHFGESVFPFNKVFLKPIVTNAHLGVNFFFILSGFVMVIAYGNKADKLEYGKFLLNRVARILPLYYVAMIMMLVYFFIRINVLSVASKYNPDVADVLTNIFLLQTWIPGDASNLNTAAWSLSAEAFFYCCFPFILKNFYAKFSLKTASIVCILFFILIEVVLFQVRLKDFFLYDYLNQCPLVRIRDFFIGNLIGLLFLKKKEPVNYSLLYIVVITLLNAVVLFGGFLSYEYYPLVFTLNFAAFIYFLAFDNSVLSRVFRNKIFIYLGEISYGIYILQFPVFFFFTATLTYFGYKINDALFYLFLLVLLFVSGMFFKYVEIPARDLIKKLETKRFGV